MNDRDTSAPAGGLGPRTSRRQDLAAAALVLVALAPFVVALATRAGRDYVPVGDIALMDLRVRDVWSSDIPLVGPYSRFGWNHPGPASFYLLAPLSAVTGQAAWATLVGHVLVHAAVVAAIAWVAYRSGGFPRLLAALALVGLAYGAMGPTMVLHAWNPNVAYPTFVLFVLLAWILSDGTPRVLPAVAVVGSILVQSHLGYLPLVAAATVVALVLCLWRDRDRWAEFRRPAVWSLVALVVVWLPPLVNELVHPSNVRRLVRSQTDPTEPVLGMSRAARILAEEFRVPPPWLGGEHQLDDFRMTVVFQSAWWLLIPLGLLIVAGLATRRRSVRSSQALLALTATLAVVGLVSLARVVGQAERYVFYWRVPLALLVVFVAAWSVWLALRLDESGLARRIAGAALAVIVVFASVTLSVRIAQVDEVSEEAESVSRDAVAALEPSLGDSRRVLVRSAGIGHLGVERAIVNELDRAGADVVVDEDLGFQFGYSRTASPDEVDEVWYAMEGGEYLSILTGVPGARVLWDSSPLTEAEEEELRAAQRELWEGVTRAGRQDLLGQLQSDLVAFGLADVPDLDRDVIGLVARLNEQVAAEGTCRCGVVAFDPEDADRIPADLPDVDG